MGGLDQTADPLPGRAAALRSAPVLFEAQAVTQRATALRAGTGGGCALISGPP